MRRGDRLYRLIDSLTPGEIRQVRKVAGSFRKDPELLKIFEFLLSAKVDQEDALKAYDSTLSAYQLSQKKRYLVELILRALRSIQKDHDSHTRTAQFLHNAKILFKKKLYVDAEKAIAKGKKLADKYEHFGLKIELLDWELRVINSSLEVRDDVGSIYEEIKVTKRLQDNLATIQERYSRLVVYRKRVGWASKSQLAEVHEIVSPSFFEGKEVAQSRIAQFYYDCLKTTYFLLIAQPHNAHKAGIKIAPYAHDLPLATEQAKALFLKVDSCVHTFNTEDSRQALAELDTFMLKSTIDDEGILERYMYYRLNYGLRCASAVGDRDEALGFVAEITAYVKGNTISPIVSQVLKTHSALILIGYGFHKEARKHLLDIHATPKANIRADVMAVVKLVLPITYLLEENYDMMDVELNSSLRFHNNLEMPFMEARLAIMKELRNFSDYHNATKRKAFAEKLESKVSQFMPDFLPFVGSKVEEIELLKLAFDSHSSDKVEEMMSVDLILRDVMISLVNALKGQV